MVSSSLAHVVGDLDLDDAVPAAIAARHFCVSVATVKGWAARGRLTVVRTDRRYGRLYRWGDLLEADRVTRETPNPNRRAVPVLES